MLCSIALQPSSRMSAWRWLTRQKWVEGSHPGSRFYMLSDGQRQPTSILARVNGCAPNLKPRPARLQCDSYRFSWLRKAAGPPLR